MYIKGLFKVCIYQQVLVLWSEPKWYMCKYYYIYMCMYCVHAYVCILVCVSCVCVYNSSMHAFYCFSYVQGPINDSVITCVKINYIVKEIVLKLIIHIYALDTYVYICVLIVIPIVNNI